MSDEKIRDLALASIRDSGLLATPNNYLIWYTFHKNALPDLNRELTKRLSVDRRIDQESMTELYNRFFGTEHESELLQNAGAQLQLVVNNVIGRVKIATDDAGAFGEALAEFSGGIDDPAASASLQILVNTILAETQKIESQNAKLQDELTSYSEEMDQLRQDLEYLRLEARTDALTGLANRNYFDQFINEAARLAAENNDELCLLLADVDNFKSFNDTYGHQLGDQVLKVVGTILRENSKGRDLAARYGGEEFCVVLPATKLQNGKILADQMRNLIATKKIVRKRTGEELRQITMSFGLSQFRHGESVSDFIARADSALYFAKQTGRNRVCTETDMDRPAIAG